MTELRIIEQALEAACRRWRWQRGWQWFWRAGLGVAVAWVLLLGAYKLWPLSLALVLGLMAGSLSVLLAAFLLGFRARPTFEQIARFLDQRQGLQERLSTAWEFSRKQSASPWSELLVRDAARYARDLRPAEILRIRLPSFARWIVLVLAMVAALGWVPEYRSARQQQTARENEIMREAGKEVEFRVRKQLERKPALPQAQQLHQEALEVSERLQHARLSRTEAMQQLVSLTEKLKQQSEALAPHADLKRLQREGRSPERTQPAGPRADAGKNGAGASESRTNLATPALEQLQKQMEAVRRELAAQTNNAPGSKESLAKAMAALERSARDAGMALPGLEAAIEAMREGNVDSLLKELDAALSDLEGLKATADALAKMGEAQQMGRDLAEQLKMGQVEAAIRTLRRMTDQLKADPAKAKELLAEVAKAVDPGQMYGPVGGLLANAAQHLARAASDPGAQSLTLAADELQRMLEQMADADGLSQTLQALLRAQMCVGTCQSWAYCNGNIGFKPGGKGGRGVGTWADTDGLAGDLPITERWDNTGIERPDLDPRGHSDRGAGKVPENIEPTKVRGQLSPGGTMPSMTLRGLSIKGNSSVSYQEAVMAAQSEAESALNRDQVPRAYQNAVRNYFNDLSE